MFEEGSRLGMTSTQLICPDLISFDFQGNPICESGWLTQVAMVPFDISQIDPVVSTAFFGAGFALPIAPWAASIGVKYLLSLIR